MYILSFRLALSINDTSGISVVSSEADRVRIHRFSPHRHPVEFVELTARRCTESFFELALPLACMPEELHRIPWSPLIVSRTMGILHSANKHIQRQPQFLNCTFPSQGPNLFIFTVSLRKVVTPVQSLLWIPIQESHNKCSPEPIWVFQTVTE